MALVLGWMGFSRTTYTGLLIGMLAATGRLLVPVRGLPGADGIDWPGSAHVRAHERFIEHILISPHCSGLFRLGIHDRYLAPRQIFLMVLVLATTLSLFAFWKPHPVFSHTYDNPQAKGADFIGDVKRLLKHRAIYPVVLINLLWNFTPGSYTPMQFFLTNQLHASDAIYADFAGLYNLFYLPPVLLYGFLCTRFPPRKLLRWSVMVGVLQFIPMAFVHSGQQALLTAVLIGLLGGLANAACIDIAIRACPAGLQGTLMMMIAACFALSSRGGDVLGSWIYGLNPQVRLPVLRDCDHRDLCSHPGGDPLCPYEKLQATADGGS